jgi:nitrite reductase/ring-hydroxylating ferredoxin subunit
MPQKTKVAAAGDVPAGTCKTFDVADTKIVIYNVDGKLYATTNTCVHQGGPLGDGLFDGSVVTCPWHAWQFDVATGEAVFESGVKIDCYPVHVDGDDIFVEV